MGDKKWLNQPVVISSLKVTGSENADSTELTTTNASRVWNAPESLKESLNARAADSGEVISLSKAYEGGGSVDYSLIDGTPFQLSTLSSMLVPNVWALENTQKQVIPIVYSYYYEYYYYYYYYY